MTKLIRMSADEIELALTVPCPKCGVWDGKKCKNTQTGERKRIPHEARLQLAQTPAKAKAKKASDEAKTRDEKLSPREKLTPEQKVVVSTVMEKIQALGKKVEFVGPVSVGPVISTYRFLPVGKTKVAQVEAMSKDFAVALGAEAILVKRMPGESAVGVFVPNKERRFVNFRDTIQNVVAYMGKKHDHQPLPLNFGEDQTGLPFVEDLTQLPHLLIAGSTGGGKSTLEHSIVASLTWVLPTSKLRLIISDTKGVEFKGFSDLPHLQFPIATSVYETMKYMQWCIEETESRLRRIAHQDVRNISEYNAKVDDAHKMPYVVFVIDELADIMGPGVDSGEAKVNSKKLATIVAKSRASGIHVIAATQRADVKAVAGSIKANFPARLTFRLPSATDSKTIITTKGAENLMSKGDMLYYSNLSPELKRLHAPFTSLSDVAAAVQYVIQRERMAEEQKAQVQSASSVSSDQKTTIQ